MPLLADRASLIRGWRRALGSSSAPGYPYEAPILVTKEKPPYHNDNILWGSLLGPANAERGGPKGLHGTGCGHPGTASSASTFPSLFSALPMLLPVLSQSLPPHDGGGGVNILGIESRFEPKCLPGQK